MGEITIKKALFDYKTVYMPYRNFAERTREEHLNDLEDFAQVLEKSGIHFIRQLGLPVIERYVARLEQKGFASVTRKRKVVAIRSLLSFLHQEGYVETNIASKVILPFTDITTPHVLTQAECDRLRKACLENLRDRAVVELLLQTGIKLSELTQLTLSDLELNRRQAGFMRVRGSRGKKERIIPLNTKATNALKDYLDERKAETNQTIFLNRFGEALGQRGVQKMLRSHFKRAGMGNVTSSTLRHTFGTQHMAKGTSIKTVQEVMGLKDIRSTAVYQSLARDVISRELQENSL